MTYTANPTKAEIWHRAIDAGVEVFTEIQEETKLYGFNRSVLMKITKPVWPYFRPVLYEDKEEIYLDLEEAFEDFWYDYREITALDRAQDKEDGEDEHEDEPPETLFYTRLSQALDCLYDDLILVH